METEFGNAVAADLAVEEIAQVSSHSLPVGTPCPNCAVPLQGSWCHHCGQKAAKFDRSVRHLIADAFEGLTHIDGRLWRTLDRLVRTPGRLTRDYLDGHRAPQIPPFRMFLVVVLIVFFAGSISDLGPLDPSSDPGSGVQASSKTSTKASSHLVFDDNTPIAVWFNEHVQKALVHPEAVVQVMEHWAHQFAVLSLLVAAPLLALAYALQRQFRFYDHLIFSMHSLSFQGLLFSVVTAAGGWLSWADSLLILAPVHLFVHMRGVYGGSSVGILARMGLVFLGSVFGFTVLFAVLLLVGVAGVH